VVGLQFEAERVVPSATTATSQVAAAFGQARRRCPPTYVEDAGPRRSQDRASLALLAEPGRACPTARLQRRADALGARVDTV